MQPEQNNTQEKSLDYGVKVLAVIGVLAMLTLGSFLTITAAKYLPGALRYMATAAVSLTSIFYQKERLVLSVDTLTPLSGKPVKVTIEHRGRAKEGAYTLTYPCLTGVTVETKFGTGTCAVPLTIALENNTVTITPVSKKNRYVDVPVTISFIPAGSLVESITESVTLTVTSNDIGTPVVTPTSPTTGNGPDLVAKAVAEERLALASRSAFGYLPFDQDGGVTDAVALETLFHFLHYCQGK
jgi:hypothetical protein